MSGGGLAIAAGLAMPGVARAQTPQVRWRMATAWPRSLETIYGSAEAFCRRVGQITEGRFEIRAFPGGELMPALQTFDAVQNGSVECGHVLTSNFIGKSPALAFDGGLPFGLNARQQIAWLNEGGGMEPMRALFRKFNIVQHPVGNVGVQMGGFFRREINTVQDLSGLKMRIGGLGGRILAKFGAVPQQLPASDIYSALERGTIDAAEWIGPADDEKLGFHRIARYYYYPGWWEGSAQITALCSAPAWAALPDAFKAAFEVAANEQVMLMLARYDVANPPALRRMISQGVQLRPFPRPVMEAAYRASFEVFDEIVGENEDFKTLYAPWRAFLENSNSWMRVADFNLDAFRFSNAVPPAR
ncbi:TRAP transporter substrate-binding protein [Humitalea sp. 24SJ18S-53]|uniref:TRAP transporter substrate-binding protein n=1 Tax=Humitalea sp. 24SJ18S-53 TaxID=3422307 RepID=UPI003D66CF89